MPLFPAQRNVPITKARAQTAGQSPAVWKGSNGFGPKSYFFAAVGDFEAVGNGIGWSDSVCR